jgi:hypothetical protein
LVPVIIRNMLTMAGCEPLSAYYGALAAAVYPFGYIYAQQLLTESITTFLFAVSAYVAVKVWQNDNNSFSRLIFYGVLITLPALSKSQHISLVCGLFLAIFLKNVFTKERIVVSMRKIVPIGLGALIILAPWGTRNYYHFHKTSVLGQGAFGEGLLKGYYHAKGNWLIWRYWNEDSPNRGTYFAEWGQKMKLADELSAKTGKDVGQVKKELAIEEIEKHPIEAFRGYIVRAYSLWIALPKMAEFKIKLAVVVMELFFLGLGITGIIIFRKQLLNPMAPVYLCLMAESILLPIIDIESRYSITLKPYLAIGVGLLAAKAMKKFLKV